MKHLYFTEGFSEYNFDESFLRINGFLFTRDISEFRNSTNTHYIDNCKNETNIEPTIKKQSWWIKQLAPDSSLIWVVSDISKTTCFEQFRGKLQEFLENQGISLPFVIINSRPKIEWSYFDKPEQILKRSGAQPGD